MTFQVSMEEAARRVPEYNFVDALTPSAHKAAFHVRDDTGQDLCLKLISPDFTFDRLEREVRALIELEHANIVNFVEYTFSITQEAQRHYIVEDYIAGEDLQAVLVDAPWKHDRLARFFQELFRALDCLRQNKIVHRDLKPSNIRVRADDGSPVVIDLGVARHLELSDLTPTSAGAQIGTPRYFAPEQFEGTKYDIDHRTDLFTSGILMYEAATGRHPFHEPGLTQDELRARVCGEFDAHLSSADFIALPEDLQVIISRLLERRRERRPHEANQVASILEGLLE